MSTKFWRQVLTLRQKRLCARRLQRLVRRWAIDSYGIAPVMLPSLDELMRALAFRRAVPPDGRQE